MLQAPGRNELLSHTSSGANMTGMVVSHCVFVSYALDVLRKVPDPLTVQLVHLFDRDLLLVLDPGCFDPLFDPFHVLCCMTWQPLLQHLIGMMDGMLDLLDHRIAVGLLWQLLTDWTHSGLTMLILSLQGLC